LQNFREGFASRFMPSLVDFLRRQKWTLRFRQPVQQFLIEIFGKVTAHGMAIWVAQFHLFSQAVELGFYLGIEDKSTHG